MGGATRHPTHRSVGGLFFFVVIGVAVTTLRLGDERETIAHFQTERSANRIVAVLGEFNAAKEVVAESKALRFNVRVPQQHVLAALSVLGKHNLLLAAQSPHVHNPPGCGLPIVPYEASRSKSARRLEKAIQQALANEPDVLDAKVSVSVPLSELKGGQSARRSKAMAIVFILPEGDEPSAASFSRFRRFIQRSHLALQEADTLVMLGYPTYPERSTVDMSVCRAASRFAKLWVWREGPSRLEVLERCLSLFGRKLSMKLMSG